MTAPRNRGWRFANPAIDRQAVQAGGLTLDPSGRAAMVEEDVSVRQALVLLLSTIPGERVMRPTYGSHLHRLIFSPNDATTAGLAIHYVRQAVERWEPRVEIVDIDANPSAAEGVLDLRLEYRVRATRASASLELAVDLGGGPTVVAARSVGVR